MHEFKVNSPCVKKITSVPTANRRRRSMNHESGTSATLDALKTSGAKDQDAGGRGGKFLTFFLAGEEYGLEILKVHEIIGMMSITSVPRTPKFIRGVINLRGKIIPIIDLRLKLEMETTEQTDETCTIVVQAGELQIGVIVDKVSEVLDIAGGDIDDAPSFGSDVRSDYILGIGKSEGRVKLLLDIDKVLSMQDMKSLSSVSADGESQTIEETDGAESPVTLDKVA
jgi:purine-binding chemotaxis protein CheW